MDSRNFSTGGCRPIAAIYTDGFPGYPEAIDLAFGSLARHGVLIKEYRNARMDYTPSEMVSNIGRAISGGIGPRGICTSHVERNNLTIRTFTKRCTQLLLRFSRKLDSRIAAVSLHMAYYNYCWRPVTLGDYTTPVKAAGIVGRAWGFLDLFDAVVLQQGAGR